MTPHLAIASISISVPFIHPSTTPIPYKLAPRSLEDRPCILVPRFCSLSPPFSSIHYRHRPFILLSPRFAHRTPQPHRPFSTTPTPRTVVGHDALASVRHISLSRTGSLFFCVSLSSTLCHDFPPLVGGYTSYPLIMSDNSHLTRSSLAQLRMTSVAEVPPVDPRNGQIIEVLLTGLNIGQKLPPTKHTPLMH
ncbi:hypothetical protein EDB86DRAFT_2964606 [Lactarius hatsudake]|nr:hypothetical protein EDB86DRAFT_2964606 [Lactarius hatsudake]